MRAVRLNRLDVGVLLLSLAAFAAFAGGAVLLARQGGAVIDPMADRLGDLLMHEGVRFEFAGMIPEAVATYKRAVRAKFDSEESRRHALRRLGLLTVKLEGPEKALPYLEESAAGVGAPLASYQALSSVLLALSKFEPARDAAERWLKTMEETPARADLEAMAWNALGKARQGLNRPQDALDAFSRGIAADPSSQNAYDAALLRYEAGELKEAAAVLETFLNGPGAGRAPATRVQAARALFSQIRARLGN